MKIKETISWIIVGVLGVLLILSLVDSRVPTSETIIEHTDTLVTTKIDTIIKTKIVEVEKKVVDTTHIFVRDSIYVPIPISSYRFFEEGLYDITAKGYEVSLSSITVFPKTITQTIETTKHTTIKENRSALFIYGGFSVICEDFSPKIGLAFSLKNKWLFGADIGLYNKRAVYGLQVGYNLLNK